MQDQRRASSLESLPGFTLALGAGAGLTIGVAVAGGAGIALGAAVGAGLGLVIGAAVRALLAARR